MEYIELVALFGLIAAVLFVGFQIRAATSLRRAQIANSLYEHYVTSRRELANGPAAELYGKIRKGTELNDVEEARRRLIVQQQLNFYDLMHHQHARGLIDEDMWEALCHRLDRSLEDEWTRNQWDAGMKYSVTEKFRGYLEGVALKRSTS